MFINESLIPPVATDALGSAAESLFDRYATSTQNDAYDDLSTFTYSMHSIIYTAVLLLFIALPIVYELLHAVFERIW